VRVTFLATVAVMVGALLAPQVAGAAGSGSFSPTGSMTTGRFGAAAAPLPGGRVLVMGGTPNNATDLKSAEIFDPATGAFTPTGDMNTGREFPAAAPLPDGRVLVAGGLSSGSATKSTEIYDPATGTWTPTTDMGTERRDLVAAPLPDGRVLVAGGINLGLTFLKSAEIYDPDTGNWTPAPDMGTARIGAVAAPLPGGNVLVAGGSPALLATTATAEVYDIATGTFSATGIGSMGTPRAFAAGAQFGDGRVLVAGGNPNLNMANYLMSAEAFEPASGFSSSGIGSMGTARNAPAAAELGDGRVLVAGGSTSTAPTVGLKSAEIYAATNKFTFALQGTQLLVSVEATGKVSVSDTASPLSAVQAKKKKKKKKKPTGPPLNPSSASGDPPTIIVPLSLTKSAMNALKSKGKVTVSARITFSPKGGLATTQTAQFEIKGKKKKKKKKK
jgi:hypothetical protein